MEYAGAVRTMEISTQRLTIRSLANEDWQEMLAIFQDKEASPYAVYDYATPTNETDARKVIQGFAGGDRLLVLWEKQLQRLIGYIALMGKDIRQRDLGYCLHSTYHRRGYAREACEAVIRYAFTELGVDRLTSGTAIDNIPSNRLLYSLGFEKTGEETCSFRTSPAGEPLSFRGSSFVLTREQWHQTRREPVEG
jgi:RimJ/RimL family protein N-acetyltransferase